MKVRFVRSGQVRSEGQVRFGPRAAYHLRTPGIQCKYSIVYTIISVVILQHCCTQWPCWLRTRGGTSSFTKMRISQSPLRKFASVYMLVTLALCVKSWTILANSLDAWVGGTLFWTIIPMKRFSFEIRGSFNMFWNLMCCLYCILVRGNLVIFM